MSAINIFCQAWLIIAFDQTAKQNDQFSLTDQFYDCFVCDESRGLLVFIFIPVGYKDQSCRSDEHRVIVVSTMDINDGPSPPTDQQTSKSSGGAKLSLEEKFSLLVDKMEKQTEQFKMMSAAFQEAQRQTAEAKEI